MSIKNLHELKHATYKFNGDYAAVFGNPETSGTWIIYGAEKHGKTSAALLLAKYLSDYAHVLYISAEEGFSINFVTAVKRAGITHQNTRLYVVDGSEQLDTIIGSKCGPRKKTRIVFIDNITFYKDDLKGNKIQRLQREYPNVLFIYLAHEENGQPYGATARTCRRFAKIIIHVEGLQAHISGRCPGGTFNIDDSKAQLYWGTSNPQNT